MLPVCRRILATLIATLTLTLMQAISAIEDEYTESLEEGLSSPYITVK